MYFEKNESLKLDFTKKSKKEKPPLNAFQEEDLNRLIEMAWQDRTTFDTIFELYGLTAYIGELGHLNRKHLDSLCKNIF